MQCREFSIMGYLSNKYCTEYLKKIFHRQKCNCSQKIDKLQPYRVFLYSKWSIVIANINKFCIQITSRGRSSRLQMIFKIDVLKDFAIFKGKHLCWSLFLITLQGLKSAASLERDSITGVFLWWKLPLEAASENELLNSNLRFFLFKRMYKNFSNFLLWEVYPSMLIDSMIQLAGKESSTT